MNLSISEFGMAFVVAGARGGVWRRLLDIDALVNTPQVELSGMRVARDFKLAVDGSTVSVASDVQISFGRFVFESNRLITLPEFFVTIDDPVVAFVALAILAKGAHFLVV